MKYTFNPGEDIPAESFQTLDPDNPVAQTPAQLIGGNDVVLANFTSLRAGDNNGKFTANIDGIEYEDLALDLVNGFVPSAIEQLNADDYSSTSNAGQSFKNVSLKVIKSILIKMYTWNSGSTCILSLYEGEGIAGTPIATASASVGGDVTFTFSSAVILKENQQYTFNINRASGVFSPRWYSAGGYSDGNAYLSLTKETTIDLYFRIINDTFTLANDGINYILFLLNEKIKTETGKAHTAVYDTDHIKITNAVAGKYGSILKLTAPTTGTDISGAGYLDLGANATEIAGTGDDYKLVRLDEDGQVPSSKLTKVISTCPEGYDIMFNDTQAYSTSSNSFVRIFSLKFNRTGNYKIKSWGWSGLRTGYIELRNGASVLLSRSFSNSSEPSTTSAPFLNDLFIIQAGTTIDIYIRSSENSYSVSIKEFTVQASQFTTPTIEKF